MSTFIQPAGGAPSFRYLDARFAPIALYQFDGSLADAMGGAGGTLTVAAGKPGYGYVGNLRGVLCTGNTLLQGAVGALLSLGSFTVEALVSPTRMSSSTQRIAQVSGTASLDTEQTNSLWSLDLVTTGGLSYAAERGAGVNIGPYNAPIGPSIGALSHVAWVRAASGIVTPYVNGQPGTPSGPLDLPTAAPVYAQRLEVGGGTGVSSFYQGFLASLKLIDAELSAAQVLEEARYAGVVA